MSLKFTTIPTKTLSESITSSATSFRLNNILGWNGSNLTSADFGSVGYGVLRNPTNTAIELFEFDPATIANSNITITRRGLRFDAADLTTEVPANKLSWNRGDTLVDLGTDTPQMFQWLKEYIDAAAIVGGVPMTNLVSGFARLSVAAAVPANPIVVGDNDPRLPTQAENNALGGDTAPSETNKFLTKGKLVISGATINGATLPVPVYQNKTDNEFYPCDANDTNAMKFVGFAITNSTDGNSINVQFSGIVSGFTGLSEGEKYYVQDAVGTIGTTIGTVEILVGVAISETELLIQKGKRNQSGTITIGSATTTTTITCGFRLSTLSLRAFNLLSASPAIAAFYNGAFTNGVLTGISLVESGVSSLLEANNRLYDSNSTPNIYMTFSVSNITDTTFDIVYTETGSYDQGGQLLWEATGEL